MKLLVLYEELAAYFTACLRQFADSQAADILVFRKPLNKVAPFTITEHSRIRYIDRETIDTAALHKLVEEFSPDAIFCGGWAYAPYLEICKKFRPRIPVVLGFDNWWTGSLSQRIKTMIARPRFAKLFSRCFVPGEPQRQFALRLGFRENEIRNGAYCCDQPFFRNLYEQAQPARNGKVPHRFLYAGRYAPEKGISLLWESFIELKAELSNDWELWCLGKGDLAPVQHDAIKHFGFVQPEALLPFVEQCGVFVLPSNFEPWGVVVHEFAAAGFPLVCSEKVGACEFFLRVKENGVLFQHGNKRALKQALSAIMTMSDADLQQESQRSLALAAQHTPAMWAEQLHALIRS